MTSVAGAMKAKDEPRYAGALPLVIRMNSSVPMPFMNSTIAGLMPSMNGTEYGGAEHGEHVLDGQRHQQARRHLVLYLNDFFVLHRLFYTPLHLVAPRRRL